MEKSFEFEKIGDPRRVRFSSLKLRSCASLWWHKLQLNRESSGTKKIKTWDRMVSKLKCKILIVNYALNLLRRLHNLKQLRMLVKDYTNGFYKISIWLGHNKKILKSFSRYVNGLSYAIQDEFNVLNFHLVAKTYQVLLRIEDKLTRKHQNIRTSHYGRG